MPPGKNKNKKTIAIAAKLAGILRSAKSIKRLSDKIVSTKLNENQ
jgi:hypothetical protein